MKIHNQNVHKAPRPTKAVQAAPQEGPTSLISDLVEDFTVGARLLSLGQVYLSTEKHRDKKYAKNPPLAASPPVKIQQPLVLVPGWKTTREAFDPLAEKLLEDGRNGGKLYFIQKGEFFHDRECTALVAGKDLYAGDAKVFEVVFSDVRVPPSEAAKELRVNFDKIKKLTGQDRLDVSAYSMGGLATRCYLDEGGKDIDQLLTLGTPHRGSQFAAWAHHALNRDLRWAVSMAGLLPADIPALTWLAPEAANQNLQALNARWPEQKSLLNEVLIVGGVGTPSAQAGWWPVTKGDGLVAAADAAPPGEKPILLSGQHHSHLNNNAEVYDTMREFFGWAEDRS